MDKLKKVPAEIWLITFGITIIHLIFLSDVFRETQEIGQQSAGHFGDFVGGYFGTIFSLLSAVLIYSTLKNQLRSTKLLSFESKFHELLRLHRDNLAEIKAGNATGRGFFPEAWLEYKEALLSMGEENPPENKAEELARIVTAFYCIFYGTGNRDNAYLPTDAMQASSGYSFQIVPIMMQDQSYKIATGKRLGISYTPFNGHHSILGHYYRHLYQLIKYIDEQDFLSETEKYQYAKTVRAQLSNHEQALLFINSLSPIGQNWIRSGYMMKYKMIKNVPRDILGPVSEIIHVKFPSGYFEWEELQNS